MVRIGQSESYPGSSPQEIRDLLVNLGNEFTEYTYARTGTNNNDVFTYFVLRRGMSQRVLDALPGKQITMEFINDLSIRQREMFFRKFISIDGHKNKKTGHETVTQKSIQNLDCLQAIATMLGISSTITDKTPYKTLGVLSTQRSHVKALEQTRVTVDTVWCPETEHGTWIARRNGKVFVTGNSTTNRARLMMGNTARVLTLFKSYALGISYFIGRNAYQSLKGATPEERATARKTLAWTMGMSFATSGLFGLPLGMEAAVIGGGLAGFQKLGKKGAIAGAIAGGLAFQYAFIAGLGGDDEDDLKAQFRVWLAKTYGEAAGESIAHGPARALLSYLGIEGNLASRLDLNQIWIRPPNKEQEGRDAMSAWMTTLAGPIAGQVGNMFMGAKYINDGEYARAFESFAPASIKNVAKATRFGTEGVQTIKKQNILSESGQPELSWNELIGQAIGFGPRRVAEVYESNTAITNKRDRLQNQRERLINQWLNLEPSERNSFFQEKIKPFNQDNPMFSINGMNLMNSIRGRARNARQTEQGLYLPRKQQALREAGAFANVE
jgi:hypothetical protein